LNGGHVRRIHGDVCVYSRAETCRLGREHEVKPDYEKNGVQSEATGIKKAIVKRVYIAPPKGKKP